MQFRFSVWLTCLIATSIVGSLSGCMIPIEEPSNSRFEYSAWEGDPNSLTYQYVECRGSQLKSRLCGLRSNPRAQKQARTPQQYSWQSNCRGFDCQIVNVFAHYARPENIGANLTLTIEAFTNPTMSGSPVANVQLAGFDATHPNSTDLEEIYLAPGEYYFRAYLSQSPGGSPPYSMSDMVLLSEEPLGIYGAASSPKRVIVHAEQSSETVHIYLNRLFKKPGSEPSSNARLRLQLSVDGTAQIPVDRQLDILLLREPDPQATAMASYSLSSNILRVAGRERTAEFVTPILVPGTYYIFAFIDENANGYFDNAELGGFYLKNQELAHFAVESDKTRSLAISLSQLDLSKFR